MSYRNSNTEFNFDFFLLLINLIQLYYNNNIEIKWAFYSQFAKIGSFRIIHRRVPISHSVSGISHLGTVHVDYFFKIS